MAAQALNVRVAVAATLAETIRDITRYKQKPNPSKRLLQVKLDKLLADKDDLFAKHCLYAELSKKSLETEELLSWITPHMDLASDLIDELYLDIESKETETAAQQKTTDDAAIQTAKTRELQVVKLQCETEERSLNDRIDTMMLIVNDENKTEKDDAVEVQTFLNQVHENHEDLIKSLSHLKSLMSDDNKLKELFTKQEELKKHVANNAAKATFFIRKHTPVVEVKASHSSISSPSTDFHLKTEKVKNPVFSGDIRTFARFKADFTEFVAPKYPIKQHQTYVLKQSCLKGPALKLVENMTDMDEIWVRLQNRYGDDVEIMNAVIKSVQDFSFKGADVDKSMVKLVDELERGVQDLEAIKGKHHIANAYTVKMLEEKMPRQIVERWFQKEESQKEPDKRFDNLFSFLKLERKQAERILLLKDNKTGPPPQDPKKPPRDRDGFSGGTQGLNNANKCIVHPDATTHFTRKCKKFLSMAVQERGQLVKDKNACAFCLCASHPNQPCPFATQWQKCGVGGCDKLHSRLVHGCTIQGIGCHANVTVVATLACQINQTLLLFEYVKTPYGSRMIAFWDNGSTISLITKEYATRNKLRGIPIQYDLETVGGNVATQNTLLYEVTLIDRNNNPYVIKAFEIEEICSNLKRTDTDKLAKLFPSTSPHQVRRPKGKVDILVGNNYATLHPSKKLVCEGLVIYESMFGSGKILGGSHNTVEEANTINATAQQCAHARITNIRVHQFTKPALDFITTEAFGVQVPEKCAKCKKGCKDCKYETHQLSREEQRELVKIRENLTLDPIKQEWTTTYECKHDPSLLKNNKPQATALTLGTEKRLIKSNTADEYNAKFQDLLDTEVVVEIPEEEEDEFVGDVFYASHMPVYKPGSTSTPMRIVINSSLKFNGVSPNDIWIKGPNSLNDMFGILLRYRTHKYAIVGDIKKMYTQIRTTAKEKHMRRLLWRFTDTTKEFKTYGVNRVMFGDKPAAAITSVAIRQTAEIHKDINKEAAEKIVKDTYVDDVTTGTDEKENVEALKRDIAEILRQGGMEMKGFVVSGDNSDESLSLLGCGKISRVLGVNWFPPTDEFWVTVKINVSKKYRGAHTEEDLTFEEIPRLLAIALTRRICQGIVYSCYDIYGLVGPITITLKISLRDLFSKELNLSWDDPIPEELKKKWIKMLQVVKTVERVRFRRCIKPDDPVVGKPILILCNDASTEAMCATAHVRWELEDGRFVCFLYASKTRVAPLKKESVPRLEMQSAVLSVRLSKSIATHSELDFEEVVHILDSKCTLATLHKDTVALKEFMGNRVSEILNSTETEQWSHVESKKNISDLGTRTTARVEDVSEESDWQRGTTWMRLPKSEWPTSQDFTGASVPLEELVNKSLVAFVSTTSNIYNIERFRGRSYIFLLRVTATIISMFRNKSLLIKVALTAEEIAYAETICVKASMHYTKPEFDAGKLRSLGAQINEEGIVTVNSRASAEMSSHYGTDEFPILTYKDPLAFIWMQHVHKEDHTGVTKTVAKSRRKYWVVRGRKLAEKVKRSCYKCRLADKKLAEQQMAPLPSSRVKIAPTFHVTSMDLFGPIEIRDTVKQRTRKKVWGVIFNCTVTRAMYIDLTEDYGTDAILQTLRRFVCIRGCPAEIQSDQGSQLIAAAKEIAELVAKWDWTSIHEWAATKSIKWTLAPAEGQHQNGLSESLVKLTKRSIAHNVSGNVLTFSQLQTVLFEISNIINSRPIGIISGSDPKCPSPITPNDLILVRASSEVPQGPFDTEGSKKITKRFRFLQELVSQWWDSWYQQVFPKLVPSYKWLQRHRNVKIGDVCLIRYKNETRATYRLGKVHQVKVGQDGLVRTVSLQYKLPAEKNFRTVDRPIHGISVIVPIEEQSPVERTLNPNASAFVPQQEQEADN